MYFVVLVGMLIAAMAEGSSGMSVARAALATAAMTLLPAAAAAVLWIFVAAKAKTFTADVLFDQGTLGAFAARYVRVLYALNALVLGSYATSLYFLGWTSVAGRLAAGNCVLAEAAIRIAPLVVSLVLMWIPLHYADALLKPFSPTLGQRLAFNVRQYLLTLMVPVGVALGLYDAVGLLPKALTARLSNPLVEGVGIFAIILGGYTVAPVVIVRLWKTRTLPPGPVREGLVALCRRVGVTFRDIRVWETPGLRVVNAAVMGVAGFARYVIMSRTLLELMPREEVEAIFAHELGHAKRRHLLYYFLFTADFWLLAQLFVMIAGLPEGAGTRAEVADVAMGAAFAAYWGLGFGYLSRAFEREADLFAADSGGDFRHFAHALMGIAHLNGMTPRARSWRHGSIQSRVTFLASVAESPDVRRRFEAKAGFLKAFLTTLAVISAAANAAAYLLIK